GGEAPEYPPALKDQGVEGTVLAQFVVNESGRYEPGTLKILNSSNSAFTAAVKDALPRMKFSAAQIGGRKVQQLVQMPFQFHIIQRDFAYGDRIQPLILDSVSLADIWQPGDRRINFAPLAQTRANFVVRARPTTAGLHVEVFDVSSGLLRQEDYFRLPRLPSA